MMRRTRGDVGCVLGSLTDFGRGIAVDRTGVAFISGNTDSQDFPTTPGAFRTFNSGGIDAFVMKIRPGSLQDDEQDEQEQ